MYISSALEKWNQSINILFFFFFIYFIKSKKRNSIKIGENSARIGYSYPIFWSFKQNKFIFVFLTKRIMNSKRHYKNISVINYCWLRHSYFSLFSKRISLFDYAIKFGCLYLDLWNKQARPEHDFLSVNNFKFDSSRFKSNSIQYKFVKLE